MKKKYKVIIFIIILIIILIGVFYFYNNKKTKKINHNNKENKNSIIIDNGIFSKYYNEASKIVKNMTVEEKVGQLFLVRYNKDDVEYLSNFYPGGYILFAKDFQNHTKDSIKKEIIHRS